MTPLEVVPAVRAICQMVADQQGVELVDVGFRKSGGEMVLEVIVDFEGGVDVDLLTKVSEQVSDELDVHDPIPNSYLLEVSSAGLERPLVKPADYVRFTGKRISVKTSGPVKGSRKFEGVIDSAGSDSFVLLVQGAHKVEIEYPIVRKAALVVDWEAELRRANINEGSTQARSGGGNR